MTAGTDHYDGNYFFNYADPAPSCADLIVRPEFVDQVAATSGIRRSKVVRVLAAAAVILDQEHPL